MYGLKERDFFYILEIMKKYPEVEKVILFGSRAMGNEKQGSDIDLAILGKEVTQNTIKKLNNDFNEEYPFPYFFDVIKFEDISLKELKNHIEEEGKIIYQKPT